MLLQAEGALGNSQGCLTFAPSRVIQITTEREQEQANSATRSLTVFFKDTTKPLERVLVL